MDKEVLTFDIFSGSGGEFEFVVFPFTDRLPFDLAAIWWKRAILSFTEVGVYSISASCDVVVVSVLPLITTTWSSVMSFTMDWWGKTTWSIPSPESSPPLGGEDADNRVMIGRDGMTWSDVDGKIGCEIGVLVALSRMSLFPKPFFQGRNEISVSIRLISFDRFFLSVFFFSLNQSLERRETHTTWCERRWIWVANVAKMKWENEFKVKRWRDEDWLTDSLQNEGSGERENGSQLTKVRTERRRGDFLLKPRMIFQVDRRVWLSVIVFFERVRWRCDYRLLGGRKEISRRRQSVGSRITMIV